MSLKKWFILQFKPNSHRVAERNLHRQGFETFLPMREVTGRKTNHFKSDLSPLFPGYMFVAADPETGPWRKINSSYGVSKLVSFDAKPAPVPLNLISGLMLRCDGSGLLLPARELSPGEKVEVLSGPFANFIATVDTIDSERRIWVLMEFMGRSSRVVLGRDQVAAFD